MAHGILTAAFAPLLRQHSYILQPLTLSIWHCHFRAFLSCLSPSDTASMTFYHYSSLLASYGLDIHLLRQARRTPPVLAPGLPLPFWFGMPWFPGGLHPSRHLLTPALPSRFNKRLRLRCPLTAPPPRRGRRSTAACRCPTTSPGQTTCALGGCAVVNAVPDWQNEQAAVTQWRGRNTSPAALLRLPPPASNTIFCYAPLLAASSSLHSTLYFTTLWPPTILFAFNAARTPSLLPPQGGVDDVGKTMLQR